MKRKKKEQEKCANCKFYGWDFCENLEKEGFLILKSSNLTHEKRMI